MGGWETVAWVVRTHPRFLLTQAPFTHAAAEPSPSGPRCRLRLASCASARAFQKGSKKPRRRTRWGGEIVLREGGFGVGERVESHVLTEFLGWHLQSKLIVDLRLGGLRVVAG